MRYISTLLILSMLSGFFPVNFALASADNNSASIWTQIGDLFSSKETKSNVEELGGMGEAKAVEEPKLSLSDRVSSWWDSFSVTKIFSAKDEQPIQDAVAPLPVAPNPFVQKIQPAPKAVEPVSSEKAPIPNSASTEKGYFGSLGEVFLKSQVIALPAAGLIMSFLVTTREYMQAELGVRMIVKIPRLVVMYPARAAMFSIWGAATAVGGSAIYLAAGSNQWPFIDDNPKIKKFGNNFRKAADKSVWDPLNNLYHIIVPERKEAPSLADKLEEAGAIQKGSPISETKTSPAPSVPAITVAPENEPVINYPDTSIIGSTVNLSGSLNLTYYNCGGSGNLGPYQDDWNARLSRKPDTTDVAYSGAIVVPDFDDVGNMNVIWDDSAQKWKATMSSTYYSVTSLIVSLADDLSQGRVTGDIKIKPEALDSLGFGQCTAGAGNFGGSIIK